MAEGPCKIDFLGLCDDAQADHKVHSGPEKAIHHYASDHYAKWIEDGEIPKGTIPAAFGENIASFGFTEDNLCIGDTFRLGTSVVQISQGRQPCWKPALHTANKKMAYLFQSTGRTGWYYRVLEPGIATSGDTITLIERPQPEWSVKRVILARLTRKITRNDAETLTNIPELAAGWRDAFSRMAGGQQGEDTSQRLLGDP